MGSSITTITMLDTPCREWQGARTKGYGHRYVKGTGRKGRRYEYIHRWVWEQINGPVPDGMIVMHRCDNPPCFRYDHLYLGTPADNMADKMSKGRWGPPRRRRTHCKRGHEFTPENTRIRSNGYRVCRACHAEVERKARRWAKTT